MANPQSTNPRAYGKVVVTTGGTPVRATINQSNPAARVGLQSIMFQAHPANTGVMYIRLAGTNPIADDRTNNAFGLGFVAAPTSATQGPFPSITLSAPPAGAPFNLADIYVDAGVNGNSVIVVGIAG